MMTSKHVKPCLAIAFALASGDAAAQICNSEMSVAELIRTGDADLSRKTCNEDFIRVAWRGHGMPKEEWDEGFGYYRACDPRSPLSRTFNAIYILYYSWDPANPQFWVPKRVPILQAGGYWSATRNKQLWARCGPAKGPIATHYREPWPLGVFVTERTHLYAGFFFGFDIKDGKRVGDRVYNTPISRAATLVHEATHNLKRHNGGSGCRAHKSCDSHWGYYGANTYQVAWLLQFRERSRLANTHSRDWAGELANIKLYYFFVVQDPGLFAAIRAYPW